MSTGLDKILKKKFRNTKRQHVHRRLAKASHFSTADIEMARDINSIKRLDTYTLFNILHGLNKIAPRTNPHPYEAIEVFPKNKAEAVAVSALPKTDQQFPC